MNHLYKSNGNFGKQLLREDRIIQNLARRKETRENLRTTYRRIDPNMSPCTPEPIEIREEKEDKKVSRLELLKKWQENKRRQKELEKKRQKPLFKVQHISVQIGLPNLDEIYTNIKGKSVAPKSKTSKTIKNLKDPKIENVTEPGKKNEPIRTETNDAINKPLKTEQKATKGVKTTKKTQDEKINKNKIKPEKVAFQSNSRGLNQKTSSPERKPKAESQQTTPDDKYSLIDVAETNERRIKAINEEPALVMKSSDEEKDINTRKSNKKVNSSLQNKKSFNRKSESDDNVDILNTTLEKKIAEALGENVKNMNINRRKSKRISRLKDEVFTKDSTFRSENKPRTPFKTLNEKDDCQSPNTSSGSTDYEIDCLEDSLKADNKKSSNAKRREFKTKPGKKSLKSTKENIEREKTPTKIHNSSVSSSLPSEQTESEKNCMKTPNLSEIVPKYVSPYVTMSRGKNRARKEFFNRKNNAGISPEQVVTTSPSAGAAYFYFLLNKEINRIQELCNKWETYKENEDIPEEAKCIIDTAIGQSNLLITKRCVQFEDLINICKNGNSETVVTCEDLHGYWDALSTQIKNLDKRFDYLEQLKSNKWEEVVPVVKKVVPKKNVNVKKKVVKASSSIRDAIRAAKMKKKAESCDVDVIPPNTFEKSSEVNTDDKESFVSYKSPFKTESRRKTSINSIKIDEGKKRISSPGLTMVKVGQIAKLLEGTPSKSILKSANKSNAKKSVAFVGIKNTETNNLELAKDPHHRYSLRSQAIRTKLDFE